MIGMDFVSFLILLVISAVVAAILHFPLKFYVRPGIVSYLSKVVFGWIGAWLGTPVFGRWFDGLAYKDVYIIPAILGSAAILLILVDWVKTVKAAS
ncbi:MAG: hypothetical protein ONB23_09465 [candidate division KSB1 bacterium]|nr:hypothetical protein [candidate division KSB1 bacterium]